MKIEGIAVREPTPCNGFTRADLLASVLTAALLVLLQLCASNQLGMDTRATACLSNLRGLTQAWLMYATDHGGRFPGNVDDGGIGYNWVAGLITPGVSSAANTNLLYLIEGRYAQLGPYTRDPTLYRCPADPSTSRFGGRTYPNVRSYAMNQAVGTKPDGRSPVDGRWLDGSRTHTANLWWCTYGRLADIVAPSPAGLFVLIDEDELSINDAAFGMIMTLPTVMLDWPATRHDVSGTISFADGSAEIHRWQDGRSIAKTPFTTPITQPDNGDILWLQARTSRAVANR